MDITKAAAYIKEHPRAVLSTYRRDGRPQMSPVLGVIDDENRVLISTRETAIKTKNLRRDPRASIVFMPNNFFGEPFVQVDGTVEIISLPDAMQLLVDYYRRASGEHPDWDDYRSAMEREQRLILRLEIEHAGPDRAG